ncbi:hypothetical protein ACS0TY_001587 [Phlomoides rotata]
MEVKSFKEVDEEAKAEVEIWNYVFGFTPMAVVKCAIELQIADVIESHGGTMSLTDLSSALACSASALSHIMRYLIHRGFFKLQNQAYNQTPLSRLLMKDNVNSMSMAAFLALESSPVMLAPWHRLTSRLLIHGAAAPFEAAHGGDVWEYASANPGHSKLINDAMACHARRAVAAIVDHYPQVFEGIASLVDVGGGNGTALGAIVKACPWIKGINFDMPHVVGVAPQCDGIQHVGGNMFECVPKADAAFLMWVLHDWSDDECVAILRKCREAIPKETGKVIIAELCCSDSGTGVEHGCGDTCQTLKFFKFRIRRHGKKGSEIRTRM